jgi:outer membrane protein assembly factor BamB
LDWLAADLRTAGPSVLFLHYPLGAEHYYVNDQDAFFETIAHLPVRAVFAGHIHREQVVRTNGFTQLAGPAVRNGANYYWVELADDAQHAVLRIWTVSVAADGTESRREVTTVPLTGQGEDQHLRPVRVDVGAPAPSGKVPVSVRLRGSSTATSVHAQVYPQHVFGGGNAGSWVELTPAPQGWRGTVDVDALAAGVHRLQVRVGDERGASYDATELFTIPSTGPAPVERWQARMSGAIQGALAERDGLVVAATTKGQVEAFHPERRRRRVVWQAHVGPVYRGPAFALDGSRLVVPSADHHLYVLDARTGRVRRRVRLAGPVLSSPLVTTVDGAETVLVTAGTTVYAIDAHELRVRWSADLHGFFAGRPACDGERVYVGSGDGNAYAFDAASGTPVWSVSTTTRQDAHGRLLYGPWDDVVTLLPDGMVLFSTVSTALALDRATGSQRWAASGGFLYPPARLTPAGLLLVDERGKTLLVDPSSGAATWVTELGVRVFNAGPVLRADLAWILAATGLLSGVDLATGDVRYQRQLGPGNTFSTPALVGDLLVTADQDGLLRGVELPG